MEYFYTPPRLVTASSLVIEGDEFAHLTHVMRKGMHDVIRVVDGAGNMYDVVITQLAARSVTCTINAHYIRAHEADRTVVLGAAILKHGASFDFLVEKATEIGVSEVVPLLTERTIPRHAKNDRWQKLALAAMKQSQRCFLPPVRPLTTLHEFLRTADNSSLKFIPHEKVTEPLFRDVVPTEVRKAIIVIGPEGGFTDEEIAAAGSAGFLSVSLGPRRLRAETAAVVAAAQILL